MVQSLYDSVQVLPGVGPKRQQALAELDIFTIEDLLTYFPFRYEDLSIQDPNQVEDQQKVTFKGIVAADPTIARFGRQKVRVNFRLLIGSESVMVTFFNQPWIKSQVQVERELIVYGRWDAKRRSLTGIKIIVSEGVNEYKAVYPASKKIRQATIQQLVKDAFEQYGTLISDIVPPDLVSKYRLLHRKQMIESLHFPADSGLVKNARRTAKFEEFLEFQIGLQWMKQRDKSSDGIPLDYDVNVIKDFMQHLPFSLTGAQLRVTKEILRDMNNPVHMNRLLQGDVGSGKTVVAAIAMYAAVTAGKQAVLMAPTEILAEQHANNLIQFFKGTGVTVGLLVGGTKKKVRDALLEKVNAGLVNIVVGTHALIQGDVEFKDLGLVITDEQHRFGVKQRKMLREKGQNPDTLAMTATPIPRTLAITTYGEMDVSIIDQLPSGRKTIKTTWLKGGEWNKVLGFMLKEFKEGHQAFVVTPLIEESEAMDLQNATALFEDLQKDFAPEFKVALLHGRMTSEEKDQIMSDFKDGKFQGLVSTTVIEVGVDVPNATVMVIQDADRFGLAQLHQLRGRVGRGDAQAFCILVADPKSQTGRERMEIMVETNDGFRISEADLKMRGQGDIFGKQQSGTPIFKVGDPVVDIGALQTAQLEASKIVNISNWQKIPQYQNLAGFVTKGLKINQDLD